VIAQHVEQAEPDLSSNDVGLDNEAPPVELHVSESQADTYAALIDAFEAIRQDLAVAIEVRLSLEAAPDATAPAHDVARALLAVSREAAAGFAEGGASICDVALQLARDAGSLTMSGAAHLSVERLDAIRLAGESAECSVSIASGGGGVSIALAFDIAPVALPARVTSFTLAGGEPAVIELSDSPHPTNVPAIATTFRLPEDEPPVLEARDEVDASAAADADDV
jgi:hypothetical protein